MRTCTLCGVEKTLNEFPSEKYKGTILRRKQCKKCRNKSKRDYPSRHGFGLRRGYLQRIYGITPEQYDTMYDLQNGVCKICGLKSRNRWGDKLVVDHCHQTNRVRGLLCDKCNKGLGQFDDSESLLFRAIAYLREP